MRPAGRTPQAKLTSKFNSAKHSMISKNEVTGNSTFRLMKMGKVHTSRAVQNELGAPAFREKKAKAAHLKTILSPSQNTCKSLKVSSWGTRCTTPEAVVHVAALHQVHGEPCQHCENLIHSTCYLQKCKPC